MIVDAGESAKTLERPGLQRALAMLKAGEADALLVVKLDRLTRSVRDLGHLVEKYFAPGKAALLSDGHRGYAMSLNLAVGSRCCGLHGTAG